MADGAPGGPVGALDGDLAELLGAVSRTLATEQEPDRALAMVLERIVPAVADWGTVRLRDADDRIRRVAAVHRDPAMVDLMQELWAVPPFSAPEGTEVTELFSGGGAQVYEDLGPSVIELVESSPAAQEVWKRLGLQSLAVIPLLAAGVPLGSMMLVIADDRRFDPDALRLVEGLALQCALLVQNTRLVREKEQAAQERTELGELLDTVLAHSPAASAILDGELRVLNANAAFRSLGSTAAGTHVGDALGPLAERILPLLRNVLVEGRAVDRAMVRSGSDPETRRYWQVTAYPIDHVAGGRLGVGLSLVDVTEERRSARRLTDSLARLDLSLAAGGLGSWDWDFLRNEIVWSGALADVLGVDPNAFTSDPVAFTEVIHPDDREDHRTKIVAAAQAGEDFHNEVRVIRMDGEERWLEVRGRTVVDAQGRPVKMIGIAADVTERRLVDEVRGRLLDREHQWRVEAEAARERLAVLSEASPVLIAALDTHTVLGRVPSLVVPRLGDWCVVDMIDEDGELNAVALLHRDPARAADVRASHERRREAGDDGLWSVRRAVRTGQAELVVEIGDEDLVAAAIDDEHLALLRRLEPRSAIAVPLIARGRVFGGVTLVATGERRLEPDDLTLMSTLAGRIGLAFDNAHLFELQGEVARALQQALLPPALPSIDHVELAARYRAAEGGMDIGGDFYDVFEVDGGWMLVVGDVCGKGPGAAAVTGMFRNTLRAVAAREQAPSAVLRDTSDTILGQIDESQFCTAALVRVDTSPGRATMRLACGGHPRPLVLRASGTVERVDVGGTLLGVLPDPALPEVDVHLGVGDSMVLYTDGVTEARGEDGSQFGEAGLIDVLTSLAGASPGDVADRIAEAVDAFQAGPPSDDRAIVVAQVAG